MLITFYVHGLSGRTAKRKVLEAQRVTSQPAKRRRYNYLVILNKRPYVVPGEAVIRYHYPLRK